MWVRERLITTLRDRHLVLTNQKLKIDYVSNSSQATAEEFYFRERIKDCKQYLKETGETEKVKIKEWAKSLKGLIGLGRLSNLRVSDVCAKICDEGRNEFDWSEGKCRYVREILDDEYKNENMVREQIAEYTPQLENLTAIPGEQLKNLDDETLRTFIKARKADVDHAIFEANDRGLAVVGEGNRDPKVSTLLPPELETDHYFALLDLAEQAKEFSENILSIAEKAKQFPIKDPEKNKEKAIQTRAFAQFFYGYNQRMLPSLHDLKWAFSDWEWFNTAVKEENYSKHGAAVKSKVAAVDEQGRPTGESRPLTRERVGDVKEELYKDMQDVALSMDIHAWLVGLVQWRDIEGQVSQRVADRRIRLSPKLSSTAFGADSGKEFGDE